MQTIDITETPNYLAILDQKEESLNALVTEYKGLTISGIEDKEGYKKVHDARMVLKNTRSKIKKDAEELRDEANKFQKRVIAREKELINIILPTEEALDLEEKRIDAEKEAIRKEEERKKAEIIQNRVNALSKLNFSSDYVELKSMSDEHFNKLLAHAENEFKIEQDRIAQEKAEAERVRLEQEESLRKQREQIAQMKATQDRIAKEQADREARFKMEQDQAKKEHEEAQRLIAQEQEKQLKELKLIAQEQKAERDRIEAEKKAILDQKEADEREKQRLIELEEARKQAAEQAKLDAEKKAENDRLEALRKAEEDKQAAIEAELSKSDIEKYKDIVKKIQSIEFKSKKYILLKAKLLAFLDQ